MKTILKKGFLTAVAVLGAVLVLGTATSWAGDMCFVDDYNSTLVGKKFSFPGPGACKPFNGYEIGTNCIISGTACGTSDNANVRFNLSATCPDGYIGTSSFVISRLYSDINQAGYGRACAPNVFNGSWICTNWHINTIACPATRRLD